ncbi:MAG: helix-turn-helix transcriptional regulator [Actinomycetaceae bacterium]|nr:helix-turn-helix transcriptional regulator [Actinomycetaceae bacterium]
MKNSLRELRSDKRLTQADLGQRLGVSRQTIIAIENGKYDPSLALAFAIAAEFSLKIEDIFDPTEDDAAK